MFGIFLQDHDVAYSPQEHTHFYRKGVVTMGFRSVYNQSFTLERIESCKSGTFYFIPNKYLMLQCILPLARFWGATQPISNEDDWWELKKYGNPQDSTICINRKVQTKSWPLFFFSLSLSLSPSLSHTLGRNGSTSSIP